MNPGLIYQFLQVDSNMWFWSKTTLTQVYHCVRYKQEVCSVSLPEHKNKSLKYIADHLFLFFTSCSLLQNKRGGNFCLCGWINSLHNWAVCCAVAAAASPSLTHLWRVWREAAPLTGISTQHRLETNESTHLTQTKISSRPKKQTFSSQCRRSRKPQLISGFSVWSIKCRKNIDNVDNICLDGVPAHTY